ncbi:ubiquinone-dependent pyruvate dehydrogenase [Pseudactinotalea sp. Z1732]|uniref:ubiquinone-dependent pyruvate dehydrogenase n=1 Tax=Micrococcales TaxID=85006 RepID=UPI003C7A0BD6
MVTIAQNIVDNLAANGVQRIYGIAGDSLNGITEAMRTSEMDWITVRHEEAGALAAAAEAATTGELAVCAGSAGPGNLHLVNGLYDAQRSRVPVLALAAHIPSSEIGSGYFQETTPTDLFAECSVWTETVTSTEQMPRALRIAMQEAVSRRGVAVLVIPGDVALLEAADEAITKVQHARPRVLPTEDDLGRAVHLLNNCDKVTILAGAGTAGAHAEVLALADTLAAPIVHAMRGKEHIAWDNPFDVGMTGLLGFASGYRAMAEADTLLMLGTDLPYQQFYPEDATIIQVDIRGEQLGRRTRLDLGLVGDVGETARALLPLLRSKDRRHLESSVKHYQRTRERLDDLATPTRGRRAIRPQYLTRLLDEQASEDAVFIPDVGSPVVWAARYLSMNGRRRLIGSFTHGTMANALSQAIGVQFAHPDRQVVAMAGDGGLAMLLGELLTVAQHRLPVKIVVFNNSSLNFIDLEMKAAGFPPFGTELMNPDFAVVAESMGIRGFRVEKSADLSGAIDEAFAHDGPALLDVVTEPNELTMPPAVTAEQVKGFTLYMIRTVMSGRGDELIDLARANLRQVF